MTRQRGRKRFAQQTRLRKKPGEMNKLERSYADYLNELLASGEVLSWEYERVTLKLADNTRYTPDFMVMLKDGTLEFHETKGGWFADDAKVKIKVAADHFWMYRFKLIRAKTKKDGGGWTVEDVGEDNAEA